MKVEVVYPDYIQDNLKQIDDQIMEVYREYYAMASNTTIETSARNFLSSIQKDPRVISLQMCKAAILCQAVPKMIVTTESDEEVNELLRRYGNEMQE